MYDLWKVEYNHTPFTEQRICDQRRIIFQKAENANNQQLRGNWLTNFEIQRIENEVNSEDIGNGEERSVEPRQSLLKN